MSVFFAAGVIYTVCIISFVRLSKQHFHILSVDEFEKRLTATEDAQIIDVRMPREYKKYRIAGAKNMNMLGYGFRKKIKKLDKTKAVMVYCQSGYRSKMVLPKFRKMGFTTIYELNEGFSGWLKAGKSTEKN